MLTSNHQYCMYNNNLSVLQDLFLRHLNKLSNVHQKWTALKFWILKHLLYDSILHTAFEFTVDERNIQCIVEFISLDTGYKVVIAKN